MHNFNVVNKGEYKHKQTSEALHLSRFIILRGKHCRYLLLDLENKKQNVLTGMVLQIDQYDARGNALGTFDVAFDNLEASQGKFVLKEKIKMHHACTDFFVKVIRAEYGEYKFYLGKNGEYSVYEKKQIKTPVSKESVKKETGKTGFSWAQRVFKKPLFVCFLAIIIMMLAVGGLYFQLQAFKEKENTFFLSNVEYKFSVENKEGSEIEVIGYKGMGGGDLVIPKEVEGHPVTKINKDAFKGNALVKTVKAEGNILIEDGAFADCKNLKEVKLLDMATVGNSVFENCSNLQNVVINATNSIGASAFKGCTNLRTISLPSSLESIGDSAFEDCKALTALNLSENVKYIGQSLLKGCKSIESINVPYFGQEEGQDLTLGYLFGLTDYTEQFNANKVPTTIKEINLTKQTVLSDGAFFGLINLKSVNLAGVTSIGMDAFGNCYRLRYLEIPSTVTSISEQAFSNNYKLFEIKNKSAHVTITKGEGAGEYALGVYSLTDQPLEKAEANGCTFLKTEDGKWHLTDATEKGEVNIPANVQGGNICIPDYFFLYFDAQSVVVNGSTDRIGDYAFKNTYIKNITFRGGNHLLGKETFVSNDELLSINLYNSSIKDIPADTFTFNGKLTTVMLSSATETIAVGNFNGCDNLANVKLSPLMTTLETGLLTGFSKLAQVDFSGNNVMQSIGESAFTNCVGLKDVTLPDSVVEIGNNAFFNCGALIRVSLPRELKNLGAYAFSNCSMLNQVTLPDKLENLGNFAFSSCYSLTKLTGGNNMKTIGEYAFAGTKINELYIPDTVESIGYGILQASFNVQKVTVPYLGGTKDDNAVFGYFFAFDNNTHSNYNLNCDVVVLNEDELVDGAFRNLANLKSVEINGELSAIPNNAFENCYNLVRVAYPDTVKSIGAYAFSNDGCLELSEIQWGVTAIGDYAFSGCNSILSLDLPDGLKEIGEYAFAYCGALTSIKLSSSVESVGNFAFGYCSALSSVKLSSGIKTIGDYAFTCCHSLTSINLPKSLENLGAYAFEFCSLLESVNFEYGILIETIKCGTFNGCELLKQIQLSQNIKNIESNAFSSCRGLEEIDLSAVERIESWAFCDCVSLKELYLPTTVNYIGDYAFTNNAVLEVVYLNSDADIQYGAFNECRNLHEVYDLSGTQKVTMGGNQEHGMLGYYAVVINHSSNTPRLKVYQSGGFTFKYNDSFCALVKYEGERTDLVLEKFIIDGKVRSSYVVASYAFEWTAVENLTITDAVSEIKSYAFTNNSYLNFLKFEKSTLDLRVTSSIFCYTRYFIFDEYLMGLSYNAFYGYGMDWVLYSGSESVWNDSDYKENFDITPYRFYSECFHNSDNNNWNYDENGFINFSYQSYEQKDWKYQTCTEDGSYVEYCDICGYEEIIILEKNGHDYQYDDYYCCGVCNEIKEFTLNSESAFNCDRVIYVMNDANKPLDIFSENPEEIKSIPLAENENCSIVFRAHMDLKIKLDVELFMGEEEAGKIAILINGEEKFVIDEKKNQELELALKGGDEIIITLKRGEVKDENCYMAIRNIKISQ